MTQLQLNNLPQLPQMETLCKIVPIIWERDEVVALWLRGSLARGEGDAYSDIDFDLAVKPEALDAWKVATFVDEAIFGGNCVGYATTRFADDAFLHHLVLSNGDMLDFGVQSAEREPPQEPMIVLGCRDGTLAQKLNANQPQATSPPTPGSKEAIEQLIAGFWMNSHKHRNVLHRRLDPLTTVGIHVERTTLMRLWYIAATGNDFDPRLQGIHVLTKVVQAVSQSMGARTLAIIGRSLASRDAICRAIEENRDEVSRVGRTLAEKFGFNYPHGLEDTVRRSWAEFTTTQS